MTEKERLDQRRARIREKAGVDFVLKRDGKVVRSRKTYYTRASWEAHMAEKKRDLEQRLKTAKTDAERTNIREELRAWGIMEDVFSDKTRRENR